MICCSPDSDLNTFRVKLDEFLFSINRKNKPCVILGNYNIDTSKEDAAKNDFIEYSSSFLPTINLFIDNIIKNIQNTSLHSGVALSDISDHFLIALFLDSVCMMPDACHTTKTKVLNERNLQKLCESLQAKTFDSVYCCNDPDTAYDILINDITDSIRSTIPEKTVRCSTIDRNPWLTKIILKSITHKNKLYECSKRNQVTLTSKNTQNTGINSHYETEQKKSLH